MVDSSVKTARKGLRLFIGIAVTLIVITAAALLINPLRLLAADLYISSGQYDTAEIALRGMSSASARERVLCCRFLKCTQLISDGDFQQAEALFLDRDWCDDTSPAACDYRYRLAVCMLEQGQHDRALEWFDSFSGYGDSAQMILQCRYLKAKEFMSDGKYLDAAVGFDDISSYLDSETLADECRETIYQQALLSMYRCDFLEAAGSFDSISAYKDSRRYSEYCLDRNELASQPVEHKYILDERLEEEYENGKLYRNIICELYVPNNITESTKTLIYYAGGIGGDLLYYSGVTRYCEDYSPDAVILFFCGSGFYDMTNKNRLAMDIMHQVELECGFVMHDLVVAGSSNGCFSAFRAAAQFYSMYGYLVNTVLSFDAGYDFLIPPWEEIRFLSDEECDILAQAGTRMCLFEQPGVGMDFPAIKKMVDHGMYVSVIECQTKDHNRISVHAYSHGLFSWGLGENVELDPNEYNIVELNTSDP